MESPFTERRRTMSVLGWPTDVISIDPKLNDDSCPDYHCNDIRRHYNPVSSQVHTIILWIPGNPGQHDWYNSDFIDVLSGLGQGYAVRSVSHAGHGLLGNINRDDGGSDDNSITDVEKFCHFRGSNEDNSSVSPLIPWTVEGQVLHKIAYVDSLLSLIEGENHQHQTHTKNNYTHKDEGSFNFTTDLKFILIGHSFGCHVIQRMCVLRPDILDRVSGFLFLMPYIRTKPSFEMDQRKLDFAGSRSELLIAIGTKFSQTLRSFPDSMFRSVIRKRLLSVSDSGSSGDDENITNVAAKLLRNPLYPRNFFELGTEELRDIPNEIDIAALNLISSYRPSLSQNTNNSDCQLGRSRKQQQQRPIFVLYAGDNDQWCPSFHGEEIKVLQSANLLPQSIKTTMFPGLKHDYVCQNRSIRSRVNDWIISNIIEMKNGFGLRDSSTDITKSHNIVDEGFGIGNPRTTTTTPLLSKL